MPYDPNANTRFRIASSATGGSILFHRPHPDPELSDLMLRMMGKRKNKWCGWTRGSFVEVKKGGK